MSVFSMKAKKSQGSEVPPAGAHPAVLVAIIDLGTHEESYKDEKTGKERKSDARKVYLVWELTAEKVPGIDRNHVIAKPYTASFGKKAGLRKMVEGWRGKAFNDDEEFDISKLLGKYCLVNITHKESNGSTYARLESVGQLPKGSQAASPKIKPFAWEIGQGDFPDATWLPFIYGESAVDVYKQSHEFKGKPVAAGVKDEAEIPGEAPPF